VANLTDFQRKCEAALATALGRCGARLTNREVAGGPAEIYVMADIAGSGLRIFIYSDEAQVQGPSVDERFEVPDFGSPDQLRDAFVAKAVELAKTGVA